VPDGDGGRLLARRMIRGEESAFEEFFEDYFPPLYRFALARAGHDPDAAEGGIGASFSVGPLARRTCSTASRIG
jgi:hypothetical protein